MSDPDLNQGLLETINNAEGRFHVRAKDLSTGKTLGLNSGDITATASCIKLFILIELARRIDEGSLHESDMVNVIESDRVGGSGVLKFMRHDTLMAVEDVAMFMMALSDNTSTNVLVDMLGLEAINLTARRIGCVNTTVHNRIDFEAIGSDIRNLATSTADDFALALELIATDRLFSPQASRFILRLLSTQQHLDLLPRYSGYNQYAKDLGMTQAIEVANKTGFFPGFRGDVAIMRLQEKNIVIAAFAEGLADKTFNVDHDGAKVFGEIGRYVLRQFAD
jgi:beta-lactamase class A